VAAVTAAAMDWQELCILGDKLQRCRLCLPDARLGHSDGEAVKTLERIAQELCSITCINLDRTLRPTWLAFQVRSLTSLQSQ
jgi:hypothetical protein